MLVRVAKDLPDSRAPLYTAGWWAHFEFTRINITPTIFPKKIEDLLEILESAWLSAIVDQMTRPAHGAAVSKLAETLRKSQRVSRLVGAVVGAPGPLGRRARRGAGKSIRKHRSR